MRVERITPIQPKGYNSYHIAQANKQLGRSASTEKITCIKRPALPDYDFLGKLAPWIFVLGAVLLVGVLGGVIGE